MIEQDKKAVHDFLMEMSASMVRAEGERDFQKEAIKDASEKFTLSKKILRKMARTYHKQNYRDEIATMEEFQKIYESVVVG